MSKRGFTLIELLVVIAIIAVLAAILFPVFAKAREKAMQTSCLNNQRQLATAILMYVQDNEEMFPASSSVWKGINAAPGILICPTKGKSLQNAYAYNNTLSAIPIGNITKTGQVIMTADGMHAATNSGTITFDNIAYNAADYDFRHMGQVVATYDDGHAAITTSLGMSNALLWWRADNGTSLNTYTLTAWQSYGSTLLGDHVGGAPSWNMTGVNGTGITTQSTIKFSSSSYICCEPQGSTIVKGFTLFYVFQTLGTLTKTDYMFIIDPAGNASGSYLEMTSSGNLQFYNSMPISPWNSYQLTTTNAFNDGNPHILALNVPSTPSASNMVTFTVDGTQVATGSVGYTGVITPVNLYNGYLGLFGFYGGGGYLTPDAFNVSEVIFYPSQLDDAEIGLQTTYLRGKYGI